MLTFQILFSKIFFDSFIFSPSLFHLFPVQFCLIHLLGASFRAFCIRLWLIMRTLSRSAGLMLFCLSQLYPPFTLHGMCSGCLLPMSQRPCVNLNVLSSAVLVIVASLISFCGSCSVHELLHASQTVTSSNIIHLLSFCLVTIKKKIRCMHGFSHLPCFFCLTPSQSMCFSEHVLLL